jgi:hypothetical protein
VFNFNVSGNFGDLLNYVVNVGYELTLGDETLKVNQTTTSSGSEDDYTVSFTATVKTTKAEVSRPIDALQNHCPDTLDLLKDLYHANRP